MIRTRRARSGPAARADGRDLPRFRSLDLPCPSGQAVAIDLMRVHLLRELRRQRERVAVEPASDLGAVIRGRSEVARRRDRNSFAEQRGFELAIAHLRRTLLAQL